MKKKTTRRKSGLRKGGASYSFGVKRPRDQGEGRKGVEATDKAGPTVNEGEK